MRVILHVANGTPRRLPIILAAGVAVAGAAAYANSFHGAFVFDDEKHIVAADNIRRLWPISSWLVGNARPVVTLSLATNYAFGGLNPFGYHVTNLLIHLCTALVLFDLIRRTLTMRGVASAAPWTAFVIALLWTVHPLQTQSVTDVIQRSESLMALFYLLMLNCLLRARSASHHWVWQVLACAACGLGMASKAAMISAPLVAVLFDGLILGGGVGQALRQRWKLHAGLTAAALGILWLTGMHESLLARTPDTEVSVGFGVKEITPLQYLMSQPGVVLHYLRLAFWPHPLCIDYGWPIPKTQQEFASRVLLPAIPIDLLLLATLWAIWNRPAWGFLGAAFFLILAPSSSIVPVRDAAVEHRMYLPLAAVIAAVVLGAEHLMRMHMVMPRARRTIGAALVVVIAATLVTLTHNRNKAYGDSITLWNDVIATRPKNPRAWGNYGVALLRQGKRDEAARALETSISLNPTVSDPHYNYGNALQSLGRLDEAEQEYLKAITISPNDLPPRIMLGNIYLARSRFDLAEGQFLAAVDAAVPTTDRLTLAGAYYNLGNALLSLGKGLEAIEQFRKAIELAPEFDKAHYILGWALERLQLFDEAQRHYAEAVRLNPNNADARRVLDELPQRASRRRPEGSSAPQSQPAAAPSMGSQGP